MTTAAQHSKAFASSTLIPWNASTAAPAFPSAPSRRFFALDDLPDKWKQYTELNESYVKAGKFSPEEYSKHQVK